MSNDYLAFLDLLPATPLQIGTVSLIDGDVATITLPGGGVLIARGAAAVGNQVFVRDGVIEGQAPTLPLRWRSDMGFTRPDSKWGDLHALGRHHISTLPRYWITRLYVALSALTTITVIWWEPEALTHRLITQSGAPGWWLVSALAVIAVVGIVDVVVNDILPDRFHLRCAKRKRHLIYVALSMGLMCMTYVFIAGDGGWWRPLVLPFWVDAIFAALVAFLDLFQRHRLRT